MIRSRLTEALFVPLVLPIARDAVVTLWQLDERLAEMAREGREPALRQIRLKWWEEQLRTLGSGGVMPSDPLLLRCREILAGRLDAERLASLAEAWGDAVADSSDAQQGAILFSLTATLMGDADQRHAIAQAGRAWAMVERLHYDPPAEPDAAQWSAAARTFDGVSLRTLPRSLACLVALNRRIARQAGRRSHLAEQALILRVGVLGF